METVIHFRRGYLARDRAENIFRLSGLRRNCPPKAHCPLPMATGIPPSTGSHKSRYTKRANGRYHNDPIKDKVYPFYMNLCYRTYRTPISSRLGQRSRMRRKSDHPQSFLRLSADPERRRMGFPLIQLMGKRGSIGTRTVTTGHQDDKNKDGIRNSHTAHASDDLPRRKTQRENTGFRYWRRPML